MSVPKSRNSLGILRLIIENKAVDLDWAPVAMGTMGFVQILSRWL